MPTTTHPRASGDVRDRRVEQILSAIPTEEHDRLYRLVADGPALWERMTRDRPHKNKVLRLVKRGTCGVRLACASAGHALMVTPRWIAEFLVISGDARMAQAAAGKDDHASERGVGRRRSRFPGGRPR